MKIMLVDDEAVVLEGISRIILQSGKQWQIIAALSSGEAALDAMECLRPEVVISDIRMFKISGIDLARFIQLNYPETLVILLTGHADFEYAQQAISYGVFEYLLKPSRYSEILSCLDRAQKKLTELRLIQNEKQSMVAQMNADITRLREKLLWDLALGLIPISADINTEIERLSLKGAAFGILFCACNSIAGMDIHLQTEKEQETYFLSALRNLFNMSVIPEGPMAASVIMVCDESFAWNLNYIKEKLQEAAASCGDIGKAGISAGCSTITLNAVNLYDCRNEALCAMNKARKLEAEILLYVPHETTYT